MLKNLTLTTLLFAATTSIATATTPGPYLGVSGGMINSNYHITANYDGIGILNNSGSRGIQGDLYAGYSVVSDNIYLGLEAFFGGANNSTTSIEVSGSTLGNLTKISESTKSFYGISVLPGVNLSSDILGYLRAGIVRTRFNFKLASPIGTSSQNQNITGGQLGVGFQDQITPMVSIRAEYVFTSYRSFYDYGVKVEPSTDQVSVGAVFTFG